MFSKDKFVLGGIMPHVAREVMNYCCPKSQITFGHQFTSISDVEKHYSDDPELDIAFPLYGG